MGKSGNGGGEDLAEAQRRLDDIRDNMQVTYDTTRDPRVFFTWLNWMMARFWLSLARKADERMRAAEKAREESLRDQ